MKKIIEYDMGAEIPSSATFLDMIQHSDEQYTFLYEVPIKQESKQKDDNEIETLATIERVIKYLNAKTGSKYTVRSKAHVAKIRARLNEKASGEDFKAVIDNMCAQWLEDPKWSKFLRPETLFSNKFWGYLSHKSGESMTQDAFNELDSLLESK